MSRRLPLLATALAAALCLLAVGAGVAAAKSSPLLAPTTVCPGQTALDAPVAAQETTMLCMVNYARAGYGEPALEADPTLAESAREKAADIIECDSFSHEACGREFTYWIRASGYMAAPCWRAGENLAWGTGSSGSVRAIFRAWMRSPTHRENVLGGFTETGIDLTTGSLEGRGGTRVWAQHFGSHC